MKREPERVNLENSQPIHAIKNEKACALERALRVVLGSVENHTITEPARLEPVLRNKRGRDSERPAHRDEEWPSLATTRESPRTETKIQHSHKLVNF